MTEYQVGDIAVLHSQTGELAYTNGMQVEIIAELDSYMTANGTTKRGYIVNSPALPGAVVAPASSLKLPRREMDAVVAWRDCAWRPTMDPAIHCAVLLAMRAKTNRVFRL